MILTYLILKTTFSGILQEANRLAVEQDLGERSRILRLELLQLRREYEGGALGEDIYSREERRILQSLNELSQLARNYGARI